MAQRAIIAGAKFAPLSENDFPKEKLHHIKFHEVQKEKTLEYLAIFVEESNIASYSNNPKPKNFNAFINAAKAISDELSLGPFVHKDTYVRFIKRSRDLRRSYSISQKLRQAISELDNFLKYHFAHEFIKEKLLKEQISSLIEKQGKIEELAVDTSKEINFLQRRAVAKLSHKIQSFEEKVNETYIANLASLTDNIDKIKHESIGDIDNHLDSSMRSYVKAAKLEVLESINNELSTVKEDLLTSKTQVIDDVKVEVSTLRETVSQHINEFVSLNDSLRKTLNFISSDALSDISFKHAKEERDTADKLRLAGITWSFFALVFFFLTFEFKEIIDANGIPNYSMMVLRSFLLIAGMSPAFYLLRESARHRTDERRYLQKGIQLATIDGYFSEHDKLEKNRIKSELSKLYFNGDDHFVDHTSVENIQSSYSKVFDTVVNNAKAKRFK